MPPYNISHMVCITFQIMREGGECETTNEKKVIAAMKKRRKYGDEMLSHADGVIKNEAERSG